MLDLDGHGYRRAPLDLGPLRLQRVVLSGECIAATTLETIPELLVVDFRLGSIDDDAVLERLAERGIEVRR